jgi:hypothetical protein
VGSIWELFFCSEARREPSRNYPLEPDGNRNKQNQQGGSPHAKVAYHACTLFNVSMRIPAKATMDSDAWRPVDPVDDDQGGA